MASAESMGLSKGTGAQRVQSIAELAPRLPAKQYHSIGKKENFHPVNPKFKK